MERYQLDDKAPADMLARNGCDALEFGKFPPVTMVISGLEVKFVYLAVILDSHSRRVIGWTMGRTLEDELKLASLGMTLERRSPPAGLIHHSDRGSQYASGKYTSLLKARGIDQHDPERKSLG